MTFDGTQKLILLSEETVSAKEIYSSWKAWAVSGNNTKYLPAMAAIGGDPISQTISLGTTFFLENGWKIRPKEANHQLTLTGNLYTRDGASPLVPTTGTYNVLVSMARSNLIDTVATGEGGGGSAPTAGQVAAAVWNSNLAGMTSGAGGTLNGLGDKIDDTQALIFAK